MNNKLTKIVSGGLVLTSINTSVVQACDASAVMEAATEASIVCPYIAPVVITGAIVVTAVTTTIGIKNRAKEEYIYYTLGRLPDYWRPGSIMDKWSPSGKIIQRRIYGSDGRAQLDIDMSDHGTPAYHPWTKDGQPYHAHDYNWNRQKSRRPGRELTEKEYQKYIRNIDKINVNRRYRMKLDQSDYDRLNSQNK